MSDDDPCRSLCGRGAQAFDASKQPRTQAFLSKVL